MVGGGAGGCGTANKFASKLGKGKVRPYKEKATLLLEFSVRLNCLALS